MSESDLRDDQDVVLTVSFKDKKQNPAAVETAEWFVDNPAVVALSEQTLSADKTSASVKCSAIGPISDVNITVKADSDLSDGVVDISGVHILHVTSGAATQVEITPGVPTDQ